MIIIHCLVHSLLQLCMIKAPSLSNTSTYVSIYLQSYTCNIKECRLYMHSSHTNPSLSFLHEFANTTNSPTSENYRPGDEIAMLITMRPKILWGDMVLHEFGRFGNTHTTAHEAGAARWSLKVRRITIPIPSISCHPFQFAKQPRGQNERMLNLQCMCGSRIDLFHIQCNLKLVQSKCIRSLGWYNSQDCP